MIQESTIFLKKEEYQKLLERIEQLEKENLKLKEENYDLRRRLGLDSTNSSKPPSSDPPLVKRPSQQSPNG
jgi:transposase